MDVASAQRARLACASAAARSAMMTARAPQAALPKKNLGADVRRPRNAGGLAEPDDGASGSAQINKQPRPPNQCSTEPTLRASPHPTAAPTHRWQRGKGARGKMLASSWSNVAVQCAVAVQTLGAGSDWRVHAAARVSLACLHARRSAKGDGHLRSRRARKQQRPTAHTTNANPRTAAEHGLRRATRRACDPSVRWCWSAGVGARDDAAKPEEGNDAVGSGQRRSPRDPSRDRLSGVGAATTRKARGRQRRCWLRTAPVAGRYSSTN